MIAVEGVLEEFEDIKGVIRIRKSKNRPCNGQKKKVQKDKQRSTKHAYKTKDRITRTPLKTEGEIFCSGRVGSSCSTTYPCHVNLITNPVTSHEWGELVKFQINILEMFYKVTLGSIFWVKCEKESLYPLNCDEERVIIFREAIWDCP